MRDATPCVNCTHAAGVHADDGHCRLTGCTCLEFMAPLSTEEAMAKVIKGSTRRVSIDVPDGYTLSVTLIPFDASQPMVDPGPIPMEGDDGP